MLLRHMLIFLNILVAAQDGKLLPVRPGWKIGEGGPQRGDIFWINPSSLESPGVPSNRRNPIACVILEAQRVSDDTEHYHVSVVKIMSGKKLRTRASGLPATGFYDSSAKIATRSGRVSFQDYYIFPHTIHWVTGDFNTMILYGGISSSRMQEEAIDRLVTITQMENGWNKLGAVFGGVYWILPRYLRIMAKAGVYIPCVCVMEHEDTYLVVRMSNRDPNLPLPRGPARHVEFLLQGHDIDHLKGYDIYPHEYYFVPGRPEIMQRWGIGQYITQLEEQLTMILRTSVIYQLEEQDTTVLSGGMWVALNKMTTGWYNGGVKRPQFGGVYWIPLKRTDNTAFYVPCVVLKSVDRNKSLVVKMSKDQLPRGPRLPFDNQFSVKGADIDCLQNYFIYPNENYDVETSPG